MPDRCVPKVVLFCIFPAGNRWCGGEKWTRLGQTDGMLGAEFTLYGMQKVLSVLHNTALLVHGAELVV